MNENDDLAQLIHKISSSKKYKNVYHKTIERIAGECLKKYGKNNAEKKARNLLHRIWNSYYIGKPDYQFLLNKIKESSNFKETILNILAYQSSVKERIPILDTFYQKIFSITGYPSSIIDHACGLNPLTILWMNLPKDTIYNGFDIDNDQIDFLNKVFQIIDIENKVSIRTGDILSDKFDYADVVFMLKLLPLLEQQGKGLSLEVMKKQQCRYMVISFPVKSLSGSEKGMFKFYSDWFESLIIKENWKNQKIPFETELVYIIPF